VNGAAQSSLRAMTDLSRSAWRAAYLLVLGSAIAGALAAQVWEVGNLMLPTPGGDPQIEFGSVLAIGDFDGDGISDLAVGAPWWSTPTTERAGAFWVYRGAASRTLSGSGPHTMGDLGPYRTGLALAAGDFDGDGRDELAVGSPLADVETAEFAGLVTVWDYALGVWTLQRKVSENDVAGESAADDELFGTVLAVGDFDDDGLEDLAVASWVETVGEVLYAGRVSVFRGHASDWLSTSDAYSFSSPNRTTGENFGFALAAGDFDGDGHADLAVGAPHRTVLGHPNAGVVEVYRGSDVGIELERPQLIDDGDFPTSSIQDGDSFGSSLAAANFHQSPGYCLAHPTTCYDDLAIGVTYQSVASLPGAGKVMVAHGGAAGLLPATGSYLAALSLGFSSDANDHFGWAIAAGHLDGSLSSPADLAVGAPHRDVDVRDEGFVGLVFSEDGGFATSPPAQFVTPVPGIASYPRYADDIFGAILAIGDLDGDGWGDLVVGVPRKGLDGSGIVQVLYGALFADGFESGGTTHWGP